MQDIQSIGGRFLGGVGGGDRRLRPHHNQNHQALKCPRCNSLNTKFCYYNNYNLSQPRYFCKSCRRHWTKGGVLRNVPVGGGCRKTKRSKPKSTSSSSPASPPQPNPEPKAISNSSSESSSLTNTATATATEAVSAPSSTSSASNLLNIQHPDSKFFASQSGGGNANFDTTPTMLEQNTTEIGMFSDMGTFTSLITDSNDVPFGFTNINDISVSPFRLNQPAAQGGHQQQQQVEQSQWEKQHDQNSQELKMQEMTGVMLDQTAQVNLSVFQGKTNGGGGFGSLDWQPAGVIDQGLFDLPNTVDQAYWSRGQWTDQDPPSLYIP